MVVSQVAGAHRLLVLVDGGFPNRAAELFLQWNRPLSGLRVETKSFLMICFYKFEFLGACMRPPPFL